MIADAELNHLFSGNMKGMSDRMAATCVEFVDAFIDFGPGLLVAAVHGPAAGISVTCYPHVCLMYVLDFLYSVLKIRSFSSSNCCFKLTAT